MGVGRGHKYMLNFNKGINREKTSQVSDKALRPLVFILLVFVIYRYSVYDYFQDQDLDSDP